MSGQHQTTPTTRDGIESNFRKDREEKRNLLDQIEKFHSDLEVEKAVCLDRGEIHPMIETTPDIIRYLGHGKDILGASGFFIYRDVLVCAVGTKEKVLTKLNESQTHDYDTLKKISK